MLMTTPRLFHTLALGAMAFALVFFSGFSMHSARASDAPEAFIQALGDKALHSLTAKNIPAAEREKRVRALLTQNFDLYTIGRFALGTYWRQASDAQQKEYLHLFEDMIVKTYSRRFSDYNGQQFKVDGSVSGGGNDTLVKSQIMQHDGPPVHVVWRVRSKHGSLKVVDVVVEDISMGVTQRDDFRSVIDGNGGDINALLKKLRASTGN